MGNKICADEKVMQKREKGKRGREKALEKSHYSTVSFRNR